MIQTQFNKPIHVIRSDNGSEFINHNVESLFQEFGIIHHRSCAYSPQQNGIVERKHRHLLQVARALMFQILGWKSPFELLFGRLFDLTVVRPLGCLVYKANILPTKSKFTTRSLQCVFLGFAPNQKGFVLFDLVNQKV